MSRARFCVLGNISIDDLVFEDGSTMWRVPGGNSIYAALGAALWQERPVVMASKASQAAMIREPSGICSP